MAEVSQKGNKHDLKGRKSLGRYIRGGINKIRALLNETFEIPLDLLKLSILLILAISRKITYSLFSARKKLPQIDKVFFVHFPPRFGYGGGDTVVNRYVTDALSEIGVKVQTIYPPELNKATNTFGHWLFGEKWGYNKHFQQKMGDTRNSVVLTDSQLSLGHFRVPTVAICHFSFLGYNLLASTKMRVRSILDTCHQSLVQAYGLAKSRNVAVSSFQKHYLELEGIRVSAIISNPMSKVVASQSKKTRDFIYLGGFSYHGKGFDVLERLAERGFAIDCYTNIKRQGPLRYLNPIPHEEVLETILKYRILLHPSRFESAGMTVLEAMSCGVPVLMADVGVGCDLKRVIPEFVVSGYGAQAIEEYIRKEKMITQDYQYFSKEALSYVTKNHSIEAFKENWKRQIQWIEKGIKQNTPHSLH